ncbi:MAG: hypothetical protein AAGA83_19550 [Cyanobacteria bacterium P01_F01_bin.116]
MAVTKIVYRFRDASIPPRYHRSYTISVTANEANVVVDSYGTQLNETTVQLLPSEFQAALDIIEKSQIAVETEISPKTVGGKIDYLTLFEDDTEIFKASTHGSGAQRDCVLCGDIKAVRQYLRSLFPNFQNLVTTESKFPQ